MSVSIGDVTTRDRIDAAAVEAFATIGYHATSMRRIAMDAGVQAASLYHWYPSKEELLVTLMRRFMDGITREVLAAVDEQSSPTRRLAAAVWTHVVYHGMHRRAAFVTDTELRALTGAHREEIMHIRDGYERVFLHLIRDGVQAGELHCRDPHIATLAILLQCTGVAVWYRPTGELTLQEIADIHVELVLTSLGARP
jgi:AcrR family transcriptional regulator